MPVDGTDGQLYGMEVEVEAARAELREITARDQGKSVSSFLSSIGLGAFADQLEGLGLGALSKFFESMPRAVSSIQCYVGAVAPLCQLEASHFDLNDGFLTAAIC